MEGKVRKIFPRANTANGSLNFFDNIIKGDTLKTPYLQTAVNYAWVGEVNLLNNLNSSSVIIDVTYS